MIIILEDVNKKGVSVSKGESERRVKEEEVEEDKLTNTADYNRILKNLKRFHILKMTKLMRVYTINAFNYLCRSVAVT